MKSLTLLLCYNLALALLISGLGVRSDLDEDGDNVCTYVESYEVTETYMRIVDVVERYFCLSQIVCTKTHEEEREDERTVTYYITIAECCTDYEQNDEQCEAVCDDGCVYGTCDEPDVCSCEPGYRGSSCDSVCDSDKWGSSCSEDCECLNDAECDPADGSCTCGPGYTGEYCDSECDEGTYGYSCMNTCLCENGATCDFISGECLCNTGYTGVLCEDECAEGYHGDRCTNTCMCQNNGTCDHVTGDCICTAGWTGSACAESCPTGNYGTNCTEQCVCYNSATCAPDDGTCTCTPGFHGTMCQDECAAGTYGTDCEEICLCSMGGVCNSATGSCSCLENYTGDYCDTYNDTANAETIYSDYDPVASAQVSGSGPDMRIVGAVIVVICVTLGLVFFGSLFLWHNRRTKHVEAAPSPVNNAYVSENEGFGKLIYEDRMAISEPQDGRMLPSSFHVKNNPIFIPPGQAENVVYHVMAEPGANNVKNDLSAENQYETPVTNDIAGEPKICSRSINEGYYDNNKVGPKNVNKHIYASVVNEAKKNNIDYEPIDEYEEPGPSVPHKPKEDDQDYNHLNFNKDSHSESESRCDYDTIGANNNHDDDEWADYNKLGENPDTVVNIPTDHYDNLNNYSEDATESDGEEDTYASVSNKYSSTDDQLSDPSPIYDTIPIHNDALYDTPHHH